MKKAVIITPFFNYSFEPRISYVESYLKERGFETIIITSDFDHRNKKKYSVQKENLELIEVPEYKKNLSISRIISHRQFSRLSENRVEIIKPDLVYCSTPPNYLIKYFGRYKKRNPSTKLVYEIGDLWPETLPLNNILQMLAFPVLSIWKKLRDKNINFADGVVYECDLFNEIVSKKCPSCINKTIYLCKKDYYQTESYSINHSTDGVLKIAYLGSINNIIDIDLIINLLNSINSSRPVSFEIIGGGELSDKLLTECDLNNIPYNYHGIIYEDEKKHEILSGCQFALNIMKNQVVVGATMKSLEYFHEGLVFINNIPADTSTIISDYQCGFNILPSNYEDTIETIKTLSNHEIENMRLNSRKVFEQLFSADINKKQFSSFFDEIGV